MEKESIEYIDWQTGEKRKYELSSAYPSENKTNLICPFDYTSIIFWYDESDKGYRCPNCDLDYSAIEEETQKAVDKEFSAHLVYMQAEIYRFDKKKKDLQAKIDHYLEKPEVRDSVL
jgi:hypothetical protein